MSNSSNLLIDRILSDASIPGQNGPGSDGNQRVLLITQSSKHYGSLTIRLYNVIYRSLVVGWGLTLSAEMQSVYSTAPADYAGNYLRIIANKYQNERNTPLLIE